MRIVARPARAEPTAYPGGFNAYKPTDTWADEAGDGQVAGMMGRHLLSPKQIIRTRRH